MPHKSGTDIHRYVGVLKLRGKAFAERMEDVALAKPKLLLQPAKALTNGIGPIAVFVEGQP